MPTIVRDYQREFDALKVSIRRRFIWLGIATIVSGLIQTVIGLYALHALRVF